jgi:hypothetical protein
MKKTFLAMLCAITCILALNSCTPKGGHRVPKAEPTYQSNSEPSNLVEPTTEKGQPTIDSATFIPSDIRVSVPSEIQKDLLGESQTPAHTYRAEVYFLNSDSGYFVKVYIGARSYLNENSETQKAGEQEIAEAKKVFNTFTNGKPSDFRIKYEIGNRIEIFDNKPVVQKKIGNALVVPGEPKSIYDDRYGFQKEKINDYAGQW